MNIYRFINSKDIRFHLQSLRYDFTLPEAAFLVWQCIDATLEEKHEAWCELIRTMPDCGMQKRRNMSAIKSMHDLLQDYMKLEQKLLREFYQYMRKYFPNFEKNRYVPQLPRSKKLAFHLLLHRQYRLLAALFRMKNRVG